MRKTGLLNAILSTETHHLQFVIKETWGPWVNTVICRVTWANKVSNLKTQIMLYLLWGQTLMEYQNVCHLETGALLAQFMVTEIRKIWIQIAESAWKTKMPIIVPQAEEISNNSRWAIIVAEEIRSSKCNNSLPSKGGKTSLSARDSWTTKRTIHWISRTKPLKKTVVQDLILVLLWTWWRREILKISQILEVSRIPRVKDCHHLRPEEVSAPFLVALIQSTHWLTWDLMLDKITIGEILLTNVPLQHRLPTIESQLITSLARIHAITKTRVIMDNYSRIIIRQ